MHTSGIWALELSVTRSYLIQTADTYVLVDTGYHADWDLFYRQLKEAGAQLSEISHIILTHHHNDHCGLLNDILRKNDRVQVVASVLCRDLLLQGKNDLKHSSFLNARTALMAPFVGPYVSWRLKKVLSPYTLLTSFPPYRLCCSDLLVDRDTRLQDLKIPLNGKIITTPGHTADSISVLLDSGECLIGDAASNEWKSQLLGAKYCPDVIADMSMFYESWEKVIAAGAQRIYPGHGDTFHVNRLKANLRKHTAEDLVRFPQWI